MYEHDWTCRWEHVDPAEFAFYPELVTACHQAGDAFVDDLGWAYWDIPHDHGIHLPLSEVGFDFQQPVRAGDRLRIAVEPSTGTSSLRLDFTARVADSEETAFTGFEQRVCISEATGRTIPLPDGLRDALAPYTTGSD